MQSGLRDSWKPLLDALMASDEPLALHEVADAVGVSRPTALRHLNNMQSAGIVQGEGTHKRTRYRPRASLQVEWTVHTRPGMRQEERWQHHAWGCIGDVDWRFPLVSRIPDEMSRRTLWRFFGEAHARGYLTPWLLDVAKPQKNESSRMKMYRREYFRTLQDPRDHWGFMFCVYGSTARGDARDDSDLDLLLIGPTERHDVTSPFVRDVPFADLAAEMSLGSPRPIHFSSYSLDRFRDSAPWFQEDVLKDAVTVYTSKPGGDYIEAWGQQDGGRH